MKNARIQRTKKKKKVGNLLTSSIMYHPANGHRTISQFLKHNQYQMHFQ